MAKLLQLWWEMAIHMKTFMVACYGLIIILSINKAIGHRAALNSLQEKNRD